MFFNNPRNQMRFNIITTIPESCAVYAESSMLGRAQKKKIIKINPKNPRDFTNDKHKTVDDKAYGGGPGMVLKIEPIYKAVQSVKRKTKNKKTKHRVILFSTRGKLFTQKEAKRLAKYDELTLICGRYEGVDERVAKHIADEELSIGEYVLSGGELPALVVTDAVARHIKGVLGKEASLEEVKGSYPVYTRPETFRLNVKGQGSNVLRVQKALLTGNQKKIEAWRRKHGKNVKNINANNKTRGQK